jgi:hypothetical protein
MVETKADDFVRIADAGDAMRADDANVDLGGIATARGVEHYFLLFAALMQTCGPNFNIRVVR